jgi:Holliday junction DNA helicase RuvA
MIAKITGEVEDKLPHGVVVGVGGIGYEVVVPSNYLLGISIGDRVSFHIAENIKEDEYTLFGFPDISSKTIYYKLRSVNGIGPKAAIAILSANNAQQIQDAIIKDDIMVFSSVAGVGKKTAQRIILELKGKLVEAETSGSNPEDQAYLALISLGFSAKDASTALRGVNTELSTQDRIKLALKGATK